MPTAVLLDGEVMSPEQAARTMDGHLEALAEAVEALDNAVLNGGSPMPAADRPARAALVLRARRALKAFGHRPE